MKRRNDAIGNFFEIGNDKHKQIPKVKKIKSTITNNNNTTTTTNTTIIMDRCLRIKANQTITGWGRLSFASCT